MRDSLRPAALEELLRRAGEHSLSFEADDRPETGQKDTAMVRWACECCLAAGIRQRLSRKAALRWWRVVRDKGARVVAEMLMQFPSHLEEEERKKMCLKSGP